jgi:GAF domain-containing protein
MRRRSKAGGEPVKTRRPKAAGLKRPNAPMAVYRRSSAASQETEARLARERDEALEQLSAASEVLKVISASPGELEPVFQAMLENAVRICEAKFGHAQLYEDGGFRMVAMHNAPPAYAQATAEREQRDGLFRPGPLNVLARVATTKRIVHTVDYAKHAAYKQRDPGAVRLVELGGARTVLNVPIVKDEELVGVINVYRQEVRPFTDKQIALVQNFAAQAVIAIENTRLLNELRESLEQQTATSEVLSVISSSPGELEPVFHAMLANALRICEAKFGQLFRFDGTRFHPAAGVGTPPEYAEFIKQRGAFAPVPGSRLDDVMRIKKVCHTADRAADAMPGPAPRLAGARSIVYVPMLKEEELIGAFVIYRQEVRPFTDKQVALLQNFAAQAVIAIENARLLSELRQRTTDLAESLEQQTATSEVLRVISSSQGELEPVFQAMLANATRISEAKFGSLFRFDGEKFHFTAEVGMPLEFVEFNRQRSPFQPPPDTPLDRVMRTKRVNHSADDAAEAAPSAAARIGGARSIVTVPMLTDDTLIGVINIYRLEVRPFTEKQIELVQNFAAQAVIAIENARLLKELRERTVQLEAQSQEVVILNQQLEQRVADQVGEIERMGRLRRFLPPQVADLIVASGTERQLESHRREITALFCDLRGFTGFSESSDPEDVMALLREYHAAIGEIIIKYSGTLERYAGDGVMVVFNDPVPVENPALQAVLMALEMRAAIGALIEKWRDLGHELGFGIGIAHGFATLGTIGFEGRFDYAAIGTVSNVASRLCDEAKPGQILISPRVRQAIEKVVTVESVGEFALKGIRRPMLAYNVLESSLPS